MANRLRLMQCVLAASLLMGVLVAPAISARTIDDGSEEVFNPTIISEVSLDIPGINWTTIDDEALTACESHPRSYYPGTVKIGGLDYPESGVRVKGGCGSSRTLDRKAAFKVNLSWDDPAIPGCPPTRLYKGLKKFTFNNQVEDESYTHERIGYDFFQKLGIPVPRAAPIRVHVNNQLWGLYLHVETIDRHFLARHFDSSDGMLYEADYGCDIGDEKCFEAKFDTDSCDEPPAGDPTDMIPLQQLNARLEQLPNDDFYPAINQIFDFDKFLATWAAASVMGFWDGYPNDANNYRIYHDPTDGRWTLIPTGIDQLFEKDVDPFDPAGMLSIRCLAEEDCKAAFRKKLAEVVDQFEASDYPAMARAIETQINADVAADPRKEVSLSEWHAAVNKTVLYMQRRPRELRELLSQPEKKTPGQDFYFRVSSDDNGEKFVFVTWTASREAAASEPRWLTAKGVFKGLKVIMDVHELTGGSANSSKVGTVTISFSDCESAEFRFLPSDSNLADQVRIIPVNPGTWNYCE